MAYSKDETSIKKAISEKSKSSSGWKYALTFVGVFCAIWVINSTLGGHKITDFEWIKLFMRLAIAFVTTNLIWRIKESAESAKATKK